MPTAEDILSVRPLAVDDVDIYLRLVCEVEAGSGADGRAIRTRTASPTLRYGSRASSGIHSMVNPIDATEWRRAWGLFDRDEIVGNLHLGGGALRFELHRVEMGMGIAVGIDAAEVAASSCARRSLGLVCSHPSTGSTSACSPTILGHKRSTFATASRSSVARLIAFASTASQWVTIMTLNVSQANT